MTPEDLDRVYTALSEAIGRVAPDRIELLLATLALSLAARESDADAVMRLLAQAEVLSRD